MVKKLLRIKDAAERLGLNEKTLRNWIYEGKVEYVKVLGRSVRVSETTVEDIITEGTRAQRPGRGR